MTTNQFTIFRTNPRIVYAIAILTVGSLLILAGCESEKKLEFKNPPNVFNKEISLPRDIIGDWIFDSKDEQNEPSRTFVTLAEDGTGIIYSTSHSALTDEGVGTTATFLFSYEIEGQDAILIFEPLGESKEGVRDSFSVVRASKDCLEVTVGKQATSQSSWFVSGYWFRD
jgi:hypothetical protein